MRDITMPDGALPAVAAQRSRFSRPLGIVTAVVVLMLAGTVGLWAHYGTAVFFEAIASGISACF